MAESIYTQLANRAAITPVDGTDYNVPLNDNLFPDDKTFESPEALIAWTIENNCQAELIQKGLQKAIIELRATFKSCKKEEVWSETLGLENVDKLAWKTVDRPNAGSAKKIDQARYNDCMKMIATLTGNGMDKESISQMVTPIYGDEMVSDIFTALTN